MKSYPTMEREHMNQLKNYFEPDYFYQFLCSIRWLKKKEIHFSDITDDRMLLFNPIGIWKDIVLEKIPNMNFLIQSDRIIYQELAEMQNLLHFRSNFTLEREDNFKNNISIPIADKEAKMTFYCVCKKDIKNEIEKLFDSFNKNS